MGMVMVQMGIPLGLVDEILAMNRVRPDLKGNQIDPDDPELWEQLAKSDIHT